MLTNTERALLHTFEMAVAAINRRRDHGDMTDEEYLAEVRRLRRVYEDAAVQAGPRLVHYREPTFENGRLAL
jgi:hypothetical protein